MSELIVLGFEDEAAAEEFGVTLAQMQKDMIVQLQDASMVVRDPDGKPHVKHGNKLVGAGALGGAFWGMLLRLLAVPAAIGAGMARSSASSARPASTGRCSSRWATPCRRQGRWFLLIGQMTEDKFLAAAQGTQATLVRSNLSREQEEELKQAFGTEKHDKD